MLHENSTFATFTCMKIFLIIPSPEENIALYFDERRENNSDSRWVPLKMSDKMYLCYLDESV